MKKLLLLTFVLCFLFLRGHSQYYPGARNVDAKDIPGFLSQLKGNNTVQKRADLLLSLGFCYLLKIGSEKTDMDSARLCAQQAMALAKQINNTPLLNESQLLTGITFVEQSLFGPARKALQTMNDSTRVKLQLSLSKHIYYNQFAPGKDTCWLDSTAHYAHQAFKLATDIQHFVLQEATMRWLAVIAIEYKDRNLVEKSENEYTFMLKHYVPLPYPTKIDLLAELCILALRTGDHHKALNYAIQQEKELNDNSTNVERYRAYIALGNVYKFLEQYDKSLINYGKISNDPARYSFSNVYVTASAYLHCLRMLKRNDETIPYLEKLHQKFPPKDDVDRSYYHLDLSFSYREMNKFELAEENMLKAIRYLDLSKNTTAIFYSYLGTLYDKFNYPEKAIIALRTAEKKFTKENELVKGTTYRFISKTEAALGNHEVAYNYLLKSKNITDSIYNITKEKYIQELEFQYQTQKKEADLRVKEENIRYLNKNAELMVKDANLQKAKLNEASLLAAQKESDLQLKEKDIALLTNSTKLQKAEIEKAEIQIEQEAARRKITVLVIVLLAVIIALLIWLFWTKLRSNKLITNKNGQLQQLLTDKSWLLKEMHHRVKNNLHIVMSLLESQSAYLQDDALAAVKNSQSRIFSMSLIHQKLYQTDDARTIDMAFYIPELICYLRECFNLQRNFHINMDIDHTAFNVTEAVPLGLIINEAVTNSMKYAFKNNQNGAIHISLKATGINEYELIMADNGIGLSEGFDMDNVTSLGFQLIKGLSDQLEARLHIANENGLKIILSAISVHNTVRFETMASEFSGQMTA
ncbi:histidine kinase dimerization/phosphoacceptor domain -containing protein [Chitinophaga niabensis]|uniref:tetratricopeptide repeat-containing sensor histidine kinase n=1 Tax=Chitinophaga niabensis TaxID=536979 RepID=UPI0031BB022F